MIEAILLDRDGVINRERADYVKCWEEFEVLPGSIAAVARLANIGCPVLVISNQSAIGRGIVSADIVDSIHEQLQRMVEAQGGRIDAFYVCPHRPEDECGCRKPKPGLLLQASSDYGLDMQNCIFVGDAVTDRQAAIAAGCGSILVETGRQGAQIAEMSRLDGDVFALPDLAAAVSAILASV